MLEDARPVPGVEKDKQAFKWYSSQGHRQVRIFTEHA
jgi:hypothetical protein